LEVAFNILILISLLLVILSFGVITQEVAGQVFNRTYHLLLGTDLLRNTRQFHYMALQSVNTTLFKEHWVIASFCLLTKLWLKVMVAAEQRACLFISTIQKKDLLLSISE
jgi:hypothetical protein